MSPDRIVEYFDGEEKLICKSLLSWMNEGSHAIPDEVFLAVDCQHGPKIPRCIQADLR
jgi:hypothetical protein